MHVISLGGFSEEAEIPGIKYVLSPYKLNLVATPLFVKPGIPYSIKVDEGGKIAEYDCLFLFTESTGMANRGGVLGKGITGGIRFVKSAAPIDAEGGGKMLASFSLRVVSARRASARM